MKPATPRLHSASSLLCLTALLGGCSLVLSACGPKASDGSGTALEEIEEEELTGTFSVDGQKFTGRISVQTFPSTLQFSVVCQNNDFGLVQITFANESDARLAQTLKLGEMSYTQANAPGTAQLSLSTFTNGTEVHTKSASSATATVTKEGAHSAVSFDGVELSNMSGDIKKVVSGKLTF